MLTKLAQYWIDRRVRAPRGLGFSIDAGLPDRGHRYGGAQTIHNTGTIDIQLDTDGNIVDAWFRCHQVPFRVATKGTWQTRQTGNDQYSIVAIEFAS